MFGLRFVTPGLRLSGRVIGSLGLFFIASVPIVAAQIPIQYFTTFRHDPAVLEECQREGELVRRTIELYDHPAEWRWIVVCDLHAWQTVETHLGRASNAQGVYLALTQYDQRLTYIRGDAALHPLNDSPAMQVDHTIRHELGHILLKTGDCAAAENHATATLTRLHAEQAIFAAREQNAPRQVARR